MRIAYFAHVNAARRSGVLHKIAGQVDQWSAAGHSVRLFVATRDHDDPWSERLGDRVVVRRYDGPASRIRTMARLVERVRAFHPDLVYLRWDLFYPPMLRFPRRVPLVVELNTDDEAESALGSRLRSTYNRLTRGLLLGRARGFVFVTSELSAKPSFAGFKAVHRVVTNGIELAAYPSLPAVEGPAPRLAFVGTADQPWHGVDKLVELAARRPDWRFDIVGLGADTALLAPGPRPPNVTWHGALERARVVEVLATADIGVGTLALHRKAMTEACPLKVREYLAVGLPILYGYADPDADALGRYALRIENTETNVIDALDAIDDFVTRSRGVRVPRPAVAHIDVAVKEGQRLALFDELVHA
jgi:glycosyltransferase involved in cell wall biosynthesis